MAQKLKRAFLASALLLAALFGAPSLWAACYTTGTTFTESWNKASGDPCWSGGTSVCQQTWAVASGSGETVTTAPGSGWNCANVLELPHAATGLELDAYGTIPYIPQGTSSASYDLNFEYYYDSTNVTAFRNFLELQFPGAGTAALVLQQNSNGSGQVFLNTAGALALSTSTRHLIHIHVAGASSFAQIDGGTQTSFTAPSADWMEIKLFGDTTGANLYFGNIYATASGFPGGFPPSAFFDYAGGTSGTTVTAALLNGGTHCGNGGASFGNWTYNAGASTDKVEFDTANTQNLASNLTVCTASYAGNTGVSIRHNTPGTSTPGAAAEYTFVTTYPAVSFGLFWKVNTTLASVAFTDQGRINVGVGNGGTAWHVCGSTSTSACLGSPGSFTSLLICAEANNGTTVGCAPITNNTWYWITFNFTTGTDTFDVYDVTGHTQIATFSLTNSGNPAAATDNLFLGAVGSESPGVQLDSYYSNVIVDYADAQFPLLPPSAPGGGAPPMIVERTTQRPIPILENELSAVDDR